MSAGLPAATRLRTALSLLKWSFVNFDAIRMAVDVVGAVAPGFVGAEERFKPEVLSSAPGADEVRHSHRR